MHDIQRTNGMLRQVLSVALSLGSVAIVALPAVTYEVGPGKTLARLHDVPWETLQPGDTVLIQWRPEPYRERILICTRGTATAPVTIRGIPGPEGQLPVIDGRDAWSPPGPSAWDNGRSVVQIGNANYEPGTLPSYIILENLDIRSGRPPYTYITADGSKRIYRKNAAAVYVERGENLIIRHCEIHDSGNGLMIGSSDRSVSAKVLVEANYIYGNGIEGSLYEHNSYTAARGITFQYNRYGPLRAGARGNNLKDRSTSLVIRYNWIEGGNRELDIVDAEDSIQLRQDPNYRTSFVYGNVLIEREGDGNPQMVHYGGDSTHIDWYRKGALYFYNNTLISLRTDRTVLFRLSTNEERCEAHNNIFYTVGSGRTLALLQSDGILTLGRNWLKKGWVMSPEPLRGQVLRQASLIEGETPGLVEGGPLMFHLAPTSPCIGRAGKLPKSVIAVSQEYIIHQSGQSRKSKKVRDLGAFEFRPQS